MSTTQFPAAMAPTTGNKSKRTYVHDAYAWVSIERELRNIPYDLQGSSKHLSERDYEYRLFVHCIKATYQ